MSHNPSFMSPHRPLLLLLFCSTSSHVGLPSRFLHSQRSISLICLQDMEAEAEQRILNAKKDGGNKRRKQDNSEDERGRGGGDYKQDSDDDTSRHRKKRVVLSSDDDE